MISEQKLLTDQMAGHCRLATPQIIFEVEMWMNISENFETLIDKM